ncbi:hypothetical protein AU15_16505 [Marinobacter salarius]|uniref:Uncharacterized protein n=1 Tax=Marinobacter salarius TaxID=1420917 RepID=W5Z4A5_9GAMM|nr:hypothetical protein AU15_16505 [Marinobacter salarius]
MNIEAKTALGVPLAVIAWIFVYLLSYAALSLLDMARGLDGDWLQETVREWVAPGLGGYVAIHAVNKILPGSRLKWVAIIFCASLVLFHIGFFSFLGHSLKFSLGEQVTQWGMVIATCAGSYIALNQTPAFVSAEKKTSKLTVDCPACGRKMNVPKGKTLKVTCPHCTYKFEIQT